MAEAEVTRRLTTIVAVDVAGYSRLMGADETGALTRLKEHRAVTDPIVEAHGGREDHVLEVGAGQVDRADVGVETLRDQIDDVVERLAEVVRPRDDPRHVGEKGAAFGS